MFKLEEIVFLKLPAVQGTVEAKVVATGGGHTTVLPLRRLVDGLEYSDVSRKPQCFADEELCLLSGPAHAPGEE